jgi:hypothetical protein
MVSAYTDWEPCIGCGEFSEIRVRQVTTTNVYGGAACPSLVDYRCANPPCTATSGSTCQAPDGGFLITAQAQIHLLSNCTSIFGNISFLGTAVMDLTPLQHLVVVTGTIVFNAASGLVSPVVLPALTAAKAIFSSETPDLQVPNLINLESLILTSASLGTANFSSLVNINGTFECRAVNMLFPELVEAGATTWRVQTLLAAPKLQRVSYYQLGPRGSSQMIAAQSYTVCLAGAEPNGRTCTPR